LMNKSAGVAGWQLMGSASSGIYNLTPNGGGAVTPVAGNIDILGDGNGLQTANGGAGTLNVTNTFNLVPDVGAPVSFVAGAIRIVGLTDVQTSNGGAGIINIDNTISGFAWNVVTSATNPNALVADNGYIPKGAGVVTFILPAVAAIGDHFSIAGYGNLWTLTQNAGQSVTLGNQTSTVGVLGSVTATHIRNSIEIVCVTANTEFQIINSTGNITFA